MTQIPEPAPTEGQGTLPQLQNPAQRGAIPRALRTILIGAFLLRVAVVLPAHWDGFGSDEKEFIFLAHQLADGHGFVDSNGEHSVRAPLFPALLALFIPLTGSSLVVPFLLVALLGTLNVYSGYALAKELWNDERTALTAALLIAFFPALVLHGALLMSETLFISLFLFALLLARQLCTEDRVGTHLLFGAVAAFAVLTRAVFFGMFLVLIIAVLVKRRKMNLPASRLLIALSVWCLLLAPWTLRNYAIHRAFVPVSTFGGRSLLIGNNPFAHGTTRLDPGFPDWLSQKLKERGLAPIDSLSEQQVSSVEQSIALQYMAANPWHAALLSLEKTYVFWIYPLSHRSQSHPLQAFLMAFDIMLWVCFIAGAAIAWKRRVPMFPVWIVLAFFTMMHAILHAEARYRLPLVPLLCVIGAGLVAARDPLFRGALFADPGSRRVLVGGVMCLILLYAAALYLVSQRLV